MSSPGDGPPTASADPEAILVRTPNWLGDLLMSTAFLQALLQRFPAARVDLIVRRGFEVLPLPHRGEIFPYDKAATRPGAFGKRFRHWGYSHIFVLPPSHSSAWMAYRSGIPRRIGYGGGGRGFLLRPARSYRHPHRTVHLALEYLDLLRPWLEPSLERHPLHLPLAGEWVERHLPPALAGAEPYIVLVPGAAFGPAKKWPLAYYGQAAAALAEAGWRVVVDGLPQDRQAGEEILAAARGGLNLCGETDPPALVALLARAELLISNDSGAMHIAAALNRPQVALFGPSNPAWTAPLNSRAAVMYRGLSCSPCYQRTCRYGHYNCLKEIAPREVVEQALRLLGERRDAAGSG